MRRKPAAFQAALNLVMMIFVTLTVTTSNPFISPLPGFNGKVPFYQLT